MVVGLGRFYLRSMKIRVLSLLLLLSGLAACKKEIETIKEVPVVASWTRSVYLQGSESVILAASGSPTQLSLFGPRTLVRLTAPAAGPQLTRQGYVTVPIGFDNRPVVSPALYAQPVRDSLVYVFYTTNPIAPAAIIRLKKLDALVQEVGTRGLDIFHFGAFNRNNYFLFSYFNAEPQNPIKLVLTPVGIDASAIVPPTLQPRVLTIPNPYPLSRPDVRNIVAIDDYFLVSVGGVGVYKVWQDGTYKLVYADKVFADSFYKWQGWVYATLEYNEMLASNNDGATWQLWKDVPDFFNFTTYHVVQDSLIGLTHNSGGNAFFTLRWKNGTYTARRLKDDGLERLSFTSLDQVRDTVYISTTGGLFKRPLTKFFESGK
jgi:hypothetical protein